MAFENWTRIRVHSGKAVNPQLEKQIKSKAAVCTHCNMHTLVVSGVKLTENFSDYLVSNVVTIFMAILAITWISCELYLSRIQLPAMLNINYNWLSEA